MTERIRWTDDRIDDKFESLARRINSLPDRVTVMEGRLGTVAEDVKESRQELREMHHEFRQSKQGLTRTEKIALLVSVPGFLGVLVGAAALLSGGGP